MLATFGCNHSQKSTSEFPTIDRDAVRQAVRSSLPKMKACVNQPAVAKNKPNGKVVLAWEIHAGGIPKNAHIVQDKTTYEDPELFLCMLYELEQVQFPEPPKGTVAEVAGYPFVFTSAK